jgi:voltage-gated potassium channel|tara:strand:- start:732 stop:1643 length:912 start_codon:yes stop_codon:yes gene_type:complete
MYKKIQKRTSELLSKGNISDKPSQYVDMILFILIILNVAAVCLESVKPIGDKYKIAFSVFEFISVIIFSVEYLLRVWSSPARKDLGSSSNLVKRLKYIFSFTGLVDFLAVIPSILPYFFGGIDLRWLRVLRLLRLLKISNYSSALEDFFSAIKDDWRSFSAALYLMLIALFLSSSLMYIAEHDSQPDKFSSIPETMWWGLITLTTVGYGDVSPITPLGKVIGALTAIMGVCTVALLTGIVASAFANQRAQRTAILEAEISQALSDGVISDDEAQKIEKLRKELNLSPEHSKTVIDILSDKNQK